MRRLKQAWRVLVGYGTSDDRRLALANAVALLVASSQPLYPLYLYWSVGPTIWPSFVTFASTPFFLAVPAVGRWSSACGRALLVIAGLANTIVSAKAFGVASGVEVFLLPCIALALLLFRPDERAVAWPLAAAGCLAYLGLHDRYGSPLHVYAVTEYGAFSRLNFMSAAGLVAYLAYRASALIADDRERNRNASAGL